MAELLGWGAGGLQMLNAEKAQAAATELDRINLGLKQAELEAAQREAQVDQQVGQALSAISSGEGPGVAPSAGDDGGEGSSAETLDAMASMYLRAGATKKATDAMTAAARIRQSEASAASSRVTARKGLFEVQEKQADLVARATVAATDQSSWEAQLDKIEAAGVFDPDEITQLRSMPYSPEAMEVLRQQSLTAYEQAQLEMRQDQQASLESYRDRTARNAEYLASIAAGRAKEAERANRVREKAGGSEGPGVPNSTELKTARSVIINELFNGKEPPIELEPVLEAGASQVAARARQILASNRGVDADEALQQAIIESKAAGDWDVVEIDPWFSAPTVEAKYSPKGRTKDKAIAIPATPDELVRGRYYTMPDGTPAKWDGSKFVGD